MRKLLVIDNYDSFTYNLVHILRSQDTYDIEVKRNDEIDIEEASSYDKIILSPGPGIPNEAGNMLKILKNLASSKPILGVCLGHQAITINYGGEIYNLPTVYHGIEGKMIRTKVECPLFEGIPSEFIAGRYHSWASSKDSFPEELLVTSNDENGEIMSFRHAQLPVYGVQFHPESIMTPLGKKMMINFMNI
ncbi:MAG: anthranilate synthase/aminodeoxychorismate synthase-like glutamine amidotransferase [Patiriisocius sp.]|jgi:anthranilate synthase/aminodeoxychorismate synthase-like glutamine amidotransferase